MVEETTPKPYQRFLPFDRLRYLMIILVVMQHAANSYGKLVPWWYVRDPYPSINPFFDWFRQLPDIIMMPVLFFIAGFFTLPSLRQKGLRRFLGNKCAKLFWPWFVCITMIVPVNHYIYHVSRTDILAQKGFFYYWSFFLQDTKRFHVGFIDSMDQFNQNFTWFISLLFFFFLFFAVGHAIKRKLIAEKTIDSGRHLALEGESQNPHSVEQKNNKVDEEAMDYGHRSCELDDRFSWLIIISVGFLCSLSYYIINSYMPYERWIIIFNVVQFQSPRLIIYISYFGLGVYAFTKQWFVRKAPPGKLLLWGSISFVLSLIFFSLQSEMLNGANRPAITLFYSLVRYFLCLSMLFFLSLLACRYLAKPSKPHNFLAEHSFYVYLNHFLLVVGAQLFFRQFAALESIIKFCGVFSFSIIGSYLLSYFMLKPFPRVSLLIILFFCLALGVATG